MIRRICINLTAVIMIVLWIFTISGCSSYMNYYVLNKARVYVDTAVSEMNENLSDSLKVYSDKEVSIPELDGTQQVLLDEALKRTSVTLDSVKLSQSRKKAYCKVVVSYIQFGEIAKIFPSSQAEIYENEIKNAFVKHETLKLVVKIEDDSMIFADLNGIANLVFEGYNEINLLNEEGKPVNIGIEYFSESFVGSCWYDSFRANPISKLCESADGNGESCSLYEAPLLRVAFYFEKTLSSDIDVKLYKDNESILSYTANLDNSVILLCDFTEYMNNGVRFDCGDYYVEISYNGELIARSVICEVE